MSDTDSGHDDKKKKNYTFILRGISIDKIDTKYNISIVSNILSHNTPLPKNTTKISELTQKLPSEFISFIDESKRPRKCIITMIDALNSQKLSEYTNTHCFWCRNKFSWVAIGCPIQYIPNRLFKEYYSELAKDTYKLSENITPTKLKNIKASPIADDTVIQENDYYETDGVFCSFNCCKAFINDNKRNSLYNSSNHLLLQMYNNLYDTHEIKIIPAPSWRLLHDYGGPHTITEFRNSFNKVEYIDISTVKRRLPVCKPIGMLYEEKTKI